MRLEDSEMLIAALTEGKYEQYDDSMKSKQDRKVELNNTGPQKRRKSIENYFDNQISHLSNMQS